MVADVRLGDFNGIQLGILAKNAWPDVRIVIMSGWDDPVLRHEAEQLGASYSRSLSARRSCDRH